MKHWLHASALLVALATGPLRADDVESLHAFNVNLDFKPGWTLQIHTRLRTFENLGAYNQTRGGPILIWQAKPRFSTLLGYYFLNQNTRVTHQPYNLHRFWGGGQYRLVQRENWSIDSRALLERFTSGNIRDYTRFRGRAMLNRGTPIGMLFIGGESLVQQSSWYGRYIAGMQWQLNPRVLFGTGWEYRQALSGPNSHVITTFVQWNAYRHTPPHVD
jgi:hypothetical protein